MLPSLGEIFGITLFTYPLMMGLAWGFAYQMGGMVFEKKISHLTWNLFFWGTFLTAWLGAKALFLLTISEEGLATSSSFWLGGGFVFYGGLLGALSFILFFSLFHPTFKWRDLSLLVPILLFSHGLGRIGCFLAGCCFGKEMEHFHVRHPVQLYEAFSLMFLSFVLGKVLKKGNREELVIGYYFLIYAILRFVLEFFRGDSIRGVYGIFSTSQWISILLVVPASIFLVLALRRKKHGI
mgnify:CR=1 FL=1